MLMEKEKKKNGLKEREEIEEEKQEIEQEKKGEMKKIE